MTAELRLCPTNQIVKPAQVAGNQWHLGSVVLAPGEAPVKQRGNEFPPGERRSGACILFRPHGYLAGCRVGLLGWTHPPIPNAAGAIQFPCCRFPCSVIPVTHRVPQVVLVWLPSTPWREPPIGCIGAQAVSCCNSCRAYASRHFGGALPSGSQLHRKWVHSDIRGKDD